VINLSDISIIDFHAHPFSKMTLSRLIEDRAIDHVNFLNLKDSRVRDLLLQSRKLENASSPGVRALIHYISEVYDCKPEVGEIDKILGEEYSDFSDHVVRILDREKIEFIQLVKPISGNDEDNFPKERQKSVFAIDHLLQLEWAKRKNAENFDDVIDLIDLEIDTAAKFDCAGLKTTIAYYRGLDISDPPSSSAAEAFKSLISKVAIKKRPHFGWFDYPVFQNEVDNKSLTQYQDFLLKHIIMKSGALGLSFHFHTGGGVAPSMDLRKVNPVLLYSLFYDEAIINSGVNIVLLHAGVPFIGEAAAAASQFPQVFVDTSWPVRTGTIKAIFETCLREVSPRKILYGSDASLVPERLGLGARSARRMLGEVLTEYSKSDWSESECLDCAKEIFNENASRLLAGRK
jgi:hypothetical protein